MTNNNTLKVTGDPTVIVTGAGQGIGIAVAQTLSDNGWRVVTTDIRGDVDVLCDLTKNADVDRLVAETVALHGGIDGVVNVAGAAWRSTFLEADDDNWNRHFEINLMGTVRLSRAAIPYLQKSQHPAKGIVNFTSQAAKTGGLVIGAPYSCAKAAVLCLTMSLAGEFASSGIRVNAVAPGIVDTPFLNGVPEMRDRAKTLPLGRAAQPTEVAAVVAFLMSEASSYLTGETVDVNGGLYMD